MADLDHAYQLFAKHPGLAVHKEFLTWLRKNGLKTWREEELTPGNEQSVFVISQDQLSVYAARLSVKSQADVATFKTSVAEQVIGTRDFDVLSLGGREAAIKSALSSAKASKYEVCAVTPTSPFSGKSFGQLTWTVEIRKANEFIIITVAGAGKSKVERKRLGTPRNGTLSHSITQNEWLAANDLHTLTAFKQQADSWTAGAVTARDKAFRIFSNVKKSYKYDGTITHISQFTWRDTLVREGNNYRGICDEWAVVQISYLRSIGIESRMKFLIWNQNGKGIGHACLEFNEGGRWTHMDALWNAFDNPGRYRASGAQHVTVMDADYPVDARSTAPAWGIADPSGDGKLHPYADLIVNPAYPGNSRPGYSS